MSPRLRKPTLFESLVVRRDSLGRFSVLQHASPETMRHAYNPAVAAARSKPASWLARYLVKTVR